eukprot:CAMPEP_0202689964 /NCGR_PEP_ID=MMETSP1385-20130828/5124_1 /ASSEMBLY_ACC=CAM_ASM_000861 /TAXON_ID=933848 /ORGANISM="Elphidium margaritaceum" /LENGTH=539 /DNA_ID=CAMNT_0049345185 /DNA_START=83 /DNA_END=1699 /DNA_ORIENTATION=+
MDTDYTLTLDSLSSAQKLSLQSFLSSIEPFIYKQLSENQNPKIRQSFAEYSNRNNQYKKHVQRIRDSICLRQTLSRADHNNIHDHKQDSGDDSGVNELGGLCLDCNSNESRIAVGFGSKTSHHAWCLHSSLIVVWNLNQAAVEHQIEIASCCTSIAYHAQLDNMLAFGLFNGTICVYELDNDGNCMLNQQLCSNHAYHTEAITALQWIAGHKLISTSMDGKLLIWSMHYNQLSQPILTHALRIHDADTMATPISHICIQYSRDSHFVLSTQCGALMSCLLHVDIDIDDGDGSNRSTAMSTSTQLQVRDGSFGFADVVAFNFYKNLMSDQLSPMKKKKNEIEIKRKIEKYLKLHRDIQILALSDLFACFAMNELVLYPRINTKLSYHHHDRCFVNRMQFSPFSSNIFLTSSVNGYIRIYSIFASKPMIELNYKNTKLFDAQWSPKRPCIIAAINDEQQLMIYDLLLFPHRLIPMHVTKIQFADDANKKKDTLKRLKNLRFTKSGTKICVMDNDGQVYIYEMCNELVEYNPNELKHLKRLT